MAHSLNEFWIPGPDDWHAHYRGPGVIEHVAYWSAVQFWRVVAMGNVPAVTNVQEAIDYDRLANSITMPHGSKTLVSPKITGQTTPELAKAFYAAGFRHLKFYPEGATTASADGVSNISSMFPLFETMQDLNMVLQIHGECPGTWKWVDVADREKMFLTAVYSIVQNFPRLRIVLEHISTQAAVAFIQEMPKTVAATVTLHHLLDTMNDVRGDKADPHRMCKPEIKSRADRDALRMLVFFERHPRVFFGSDTAPHRLADKHSAQICSGVFSGPGLMPKLAEFFLEFVSLQVLGEFTSSFGADFYGVERNQGRLYFQREPWKLDEDLGPDGLIGGARPYLLGQTLQFQTHKD